MKRFILFLSLVLGVAAPQLDARRPGRLPRPKADYVIIVSMDGFRYDYPDLYHTPALDEMAANGVSAVMVPSYPSSTFPNHYALATGLVPDHNGLVNNSFWDPDIDRSYSIGARDKDDPRFYFGEPLWNTAQRQGVTAGVVYWVGSEFLIGGARPRYYRVYGRDMLGYEERVDSVLALLDKPRRDRPHLIMLYFDEPDHQGHEHGPLSPEVAGAVEYADKMIGRLREGLSRRRDARKIDLIVLSDHGMTEMSPDRILRPSDYIKSSWYKRMITGAPTSIFSRDAACRDSLLTALRRMPHVRVWKKEEIPAELRYGTSRRIGDIVVDPDLGWRISEKVRTHKGDHGFDPHSAEMQVIFRAEGPDFRRGYRAPSFRNVSVYPLACHLLGIRPAPCDGDISEMATMLR